MSFCTHCGVKLALGAKFCTACGAAIAGGSPSRAGDAPPKSAPRAAAAIVEPPDAAPKSSPGRRRAVVVAGLVTAAALIAAVLLALGPDAPPPKTTPTVTATPPVPPATASAPPAAPPSAPPGAGTAERWERYTNTRYGVVIDYPTDLFQAEPAPPDNAGRAFNAPAAKARFSVYSHANAFNASREELEAEDVLSLGDDRPEKLAGENWYALIATTDSEVIVRRVLLSEAGAMVHRLEIAYPKTAAKAFQPVVARMMKTFSVDPSIPEKAAESADAGDRGAPGSPRASPPSLGRTAQRRPPMEIAAAPPQAAGWQSVDTIALGLRPLNAKRAAGLGFEIPGDWTRVPLPEKYQLEFAAPANSRDAPLRVLIQAVRAPVNTSLAREAEAIKSIIRSGVNDYHEQDEADIQVALRPARRLTLTFQALDETYPQRNEYLLVRAGETVFTILVQGPQAKADEIRRVLSRMVETIGVTE